MAIKSKTPSRAWSRLHFLVRFAGLSGLVCCGIGVALTFLAGILSWDALGDPEFVRAVISGESGDRTSRVALILLFGGAALALLTVLVEVLATLRLVAGRRSAFGLNAAVQVGLAVALLVGINLYSYRNYVRVDLTREQQFTLPAQIQDELSQLKDPTTIVVYQRHKTFGHLSDKPDVYDYAAERKVVEKVKDLIDQFREFSTRFRVVVLDVEEEGYNDKLAALTENNKPLREAIESAPENSIFFLAGDKVQRLSFNDFYQLDKTASKQADHGNGNLVLLYQGVRPFANKVLNVDEKRPKIGVAVIHEWLTTEGPEEFGFGGLKKALTARGFVVRDILLKKWSEIAPPEPAVYTYEESKFDRLEEQLAELNSDVKSIEGELKTLAEVQKLWKTASLDELTKKYAKQLGDRRVDEGLRKRQLAFLEQNALILNAVVTQYRTDRDETAKEKQSLNVDTAAEERRMTDLKAKLQRSLADCDLLFIPRMTIRNVVVGDRIPNQLYRLDEAQVAAIKDFLKSGKPVLACFGPTSEHPNDRMSMTRLGPSGPDELEDLLSKLGIKMGSQTILYNVESKSFAERRTGLLVAGAAVDVPPVDFETKGEAPRPLAKPAAAQRPDNRIRQSMRIAAHSLGKSLDLRVRYPRPIYYEPREGQEPKFEPEFMLTPAATWNEDQPYPSREHVPRFEPPKADDPTKGTLDEKRRGPFPIGVAIETKLPADWYADSKGTPPATVRIAAVGNGTLFTGGELSPAKEELLLDTCNWLLGRDDLLPRADRVWQFPRVTLTPREHTLWRWGTWVGLPGLFAYLGLVVLMVRRLR
jgi:hypothetical protein